MQLIRTALLLVPFSAAVMLVSGCEQKQPMVYVLEGPQDVTLSVYRDAGATASDDVSGDLTAQIVVDNPVNTAIVGTYLISYDVSDFAGNQSPTVTRTVTVEAATGGGGGGGSIGLWGVAALTWLALRRRRAVNPARITRAGFRSEPSSS
jgi:MYXO-CTERM domain-containing protein